MDDHERPGSGPIPDPAPIRVPAPGSPGGSSLARDAARDFDEDSARDFDEWVAWVDREAAAGRDPIPPERAHGAQGVSVSLGDAADIDQELLAAMCGPEGLGGEGLGPQFAQDATADALRPGPVLTALTEAAIRDVTSLTDNQLIGVLRAACRQENREAW